MNCHLPPSGRFFSCSKIDGVVTLWTEIANFIQSVGFPVFVASYVLVRLEPSINGLNKSVRLLSIIIAKQTGMSADEVEREYENGGR